MNLLMMYAIKIQELIGHLFVIKRAYIQPKSCLGGSHLTGVDLMECWCFSNMSLTLLIFFLLFLVSSYCTIFLYLFLTFQILAPTILHLSVTNVKQIEEVILGRETSRLEYVDKLIFKMLPTIPHHHLFPP